MNLIHQELNIHNLRRMLANKYLPQDRHHRIREWVSQILVKELTNKLPTLEKLEMNQLKEVDQELLYSQVADQLRVDHPQFLVNLMVFQLQGRYQTLELNLSSDNHYNLTLYSKDTAPNLELFKLINLVKTLIWVLIKIGLREATAG